ncbi:MAG TPA: nucleoside-diphosphate sugar epimerase/dehydratase [Gemmatimonadales bacterium]
MRLLEWLYATAYTFRRIVSLSLYAGIVVVAYLAAYLLRFDFAFPAGYFRTFIETLVLLLGVRVICSMIFGLSTGRWRFISTRDVQQLVANSLVGSVVFLALATLIPFVPPVPLPVVFMEWVLTTFLTAGLWISYRRAYETLRHHRAGFNGSARRVLIVGAGEAGNLLAREMVRMPTGMRPVGFVDDDPTRLGIRLHGLPVFGPVAQLPEITASEGIEEIIIAVPSGSPAELRRIVHQCEEAQRPFKVLPGIAEVLAGNIQLEQLRDVRIEDLLGREPIQLTLPELAAELAGSSVLITGAAGSIGSELARQVALHGPATLVLFDQAETELFYLDMELRERHHGLRIIPVVGDVVDGAAVERAFREYRPDRIFHAAAYKHVPMMESNPREAVRNNVIGTWRVAEAAGRHGAEKFVLVSTDKAVRPVSVMGASKRLAELVVLELQADYRDTTFAAVRFGNVLGSAGSVIPIFRKQIADGRPLTVTHPDATRYFMTIPEAVQLILQTSLLPEVRGSIAMLEMGEPVRIDDLAKNLLELSGVRRVSGKHIVYTGLRPGERLHEELTAPDEQAVATGNAKVRIVRSRNGCGKPVTAALEEWERQLDDGQHLAVLEAMAEFCGGVELNPSERLVG